MLPENIHTSTTEGIGNSGGVGGSKGLEIPEGRGGDRSKHGFLFILKNVLFKDINDTEIPITFSKKMI